MSLSDAIYQERERDDYAKVKRALRDIPTMSLTQLRAIVTSDWPWGAKVRKAALDRIERKARCAGIDDVMSPSAPRNGW